MLILWCLGSIEVLQRVWLKDVFYLIVLSELYVFFFVYFIFFFGVNWVIEDLELLEFFKFKL